MKCLTCKRNTQFNNLKKRKTNNGVHYAVGTCSTCGRRQSVFLGEKGKGIFQNYEKLTK